MNHSESLPVSFLLVNEGVIRPIRRQHLTTSVYLQKHFEQFAEEKDHKHTHVLSHTNYTLSMQPIKHYNIISIDLLLIQQHECRGQETART